MFKKDRYIVTGIDQDTAPDKRQQDVAYDATNIRIVNNGRNLSVKPMKEASEFASNFTSTEKVLGSIEINNMLYVFIHNTSTGNDAISSINSSGVRTDLITGDFDFDPDYRIECVANYENADIIKIYWTDGLNPLRFINVADPSTKINIVETIDLDQPTTSIVNGGNLINGNIQYVYNLYNQNGSESVLSPASEILSICTFMDGGPSGESSGLSAQVEVADVDTDFDYIRLYSIHWQEKDQTPSITLVADESVDPGGTFLFIDDGNAFVSELSEAELFSIGGRPLVVGTLTSKRNRLFVANYSASNFDVDIDVRAFGHAISSTNYSVDSTVRQLPTVPGDTDDCINDDYDTYAYIASSTTEGVEGLYIRITYNTSILANGSSIPSHKSLKQREIYRIGIKFFNTYGQETPVKWISDIKIPSFAGGLNYLPIVGLNVLFINGADTLLTAAGVVKYQLVSVERKPWDRTITSQGFIVPGVQYKDSSSNLLSPYTHPYYITKEIKSAASTLGSNIHEDYELNVDWQTLSGTNFPEKDDTTMFFYSADTIFENTLDSVSTIRPLGIAYGSVGTTKVVLYEDGAVSDVAVYAAPTTDNLDTIIGDSNYPECILAFSDHGYGAPIDTYGVHLSRRYAQRIYVAEDDITLDSPSVFLQEGETKDVDGTVTASNIVDIYQLLVDPSSVGDTSYYSKFANSVVLRFSTSTWHNDGSIDWGIFSPTQSAGDTKLPIIELVRTVSNQYNGNSYEVKNRNTYLDNGSLYDIDTSSHTHYVGDVFIGPVAVHRCDGEDDKRDHYFSVYEYVTVGILENNHNVYARNDNLYEWVTGGFNTTTNYQFFRIADNHKLTTGYDQPANFFVSFGKPVNFSSVDTYNNVVQASEQKFPGELIDSWLKFPINDTMALEGNYGSINKLYNFKGEVLSLQDSGIAILSINPRIQTQATDGVNIELGIGAVLYDYKYLTTKSGTTDKFTVVDDSKQLFYYDSRFNTINVLSDDKISTLLGVRNILEAQNNGVVSAVYHRELDEVIFVLDSYSLIYSNILQKFVTKYSDESNFDKYPFTYMDKLLVKIDSDGIYQRYVGTNYKPSSITYFFGPAATFEKVFHNLEYRLFGQNFNQIQVIGNLNDSGVAQAIDLKTKFDNHRVHLPRISNTRERFREHNILVKLLNAGGASADYSLDDMVIMYNIKG